MPPPLRDRSPRLACLALALAACAAPVPSEREVAAPVLPALAHLSAPGEERVRATVLVVQEPQAVRFLLDAHGLATGEHALGLEADPARSLAAEILGVSVADARGRLALDRRLPDAQLLGPTGLVGRRLVLAGPDGALAGTIERRIELRSPSPSGPPPDSKAADRPRGGGHP